jgi:hypothetical protein
MTSRLKGSTIAMLFLATSGIASCSIFDPGGPRIQVSLIVQRTLTGASSLSVDVGGRSVSLRASDVVGGRTDRILDASGFGSQPVQVRLLGSAGDTLAAVTFSQSFERDYAYGIGAVVSRVRPIGPCAGTILAAPIRTSTADTLFVAYSGLPSDAIC